ncbi:hypothetical protein JHU38_11310 [Prevotella sp. A2931]|uniref:DKNYY family protein n=1 Tax=Prevotella illustrans TaxID=2800387 RepID=A0ABS3M838_9BACT|nr:MULTISPECIES: hypothetical protein [Prevotella]MBO1364344.1 hypothetical protein [Prevotella illustrans]
MKHITILSLSILFSSLSCKAQTTTYPQTPTTYEEVTSVDQMIDGEDYLITYKKGKKYHAFIERSKSETNPNLIGYSYYNSKSEPVAQEKDKMFLVTGVSNILTYKKDGDLSAFIDKKHHAYLANSRANDGYFILSPIYTEACKVSFKNGTDFQIMIDGKTLKLRQSGGEYKLYSIDNKNKPDNITILHINYGEKYLDKINGWGNNLYHTTGNLHFNCHFGDNTDNTFIAPFYIYDYKSVFGTQVTAYELTTINNEKLTFKEVEHDLKADTPYILTGTFTKKEQDWYVAPATQLNYEGTDVSKRIGEYTFHGIYQQQVDASKIANSYILYNNAFYATANKHNITVAPYRWYFTKTNSQGAKPQKIAIGFESLKDNPKQDSNTTAIESIRQHRKADTRIYDLQGREVKKPLKGGLYIQRGKKFVANQ